MSKYITKFETEAAYQAALPTLDLPNVSLVDELGEVHYHRVLYGAHAGDICLYDVTEGQKIFVTKDDWNLTDYPTASYPIIGIVALPETATGLTVVSTLFCAADGSQTTTDNTYKWQNTYFDWGLTKYGTGDQAKTDLNGKSNTTAIINAIKAYDLAHSTDNITGNIGDIIQKYHTEGTIAGDWYVPAAGESYNVYLNKATIQTTLTKIYNASSSLSVSASNWFKSDWISSSSECSYDIAWRLDPSNGYASNGNGKLSSISVRAFLRV